MTTSLKDSAGGSYIIYNRGHNYQKVRNVNICAYSVKRMLEEGENRNIFAAGKFQITPEVLKSAVIYLELDTDLLFNEEMQYYIFDKYLIKKKRPEIIKYLEADGDLEQALYGTAREWAGVGVRKGKEISRGRTAQADGVSYYSDDRINKAHIMPEIMKIALVNSKNAKLDVKPTYVLTPAGQSVKGGVPPSAEQSRAQTLPSASESAKYSDACEKWMAIAWAEIGQAEIKTAGKHNPRIIEYHASTFGKYKNDEEAWCSSFVNWVIRKAGIKGDLYLKANIVLPKIEDLDEELVEMLESKLPEK